MRRFRLGFFPDCIILNLQGRKTQCILCYFIYQYSLSIFLCKIDRLFDQDRHLAKKDDYEPEENT